MLWLIVLIFIVLVAFMVIIYTMPSDSTSKVKKKAKEVRAQLIADPMAVAAGKDWKSIAERWEKQNNALLGDVEKLKMQQKDLEKQLEAVKSKETVLIDKLSQEKGWREKEQANFDKLKEHEKGLKDQIYRTEADLEKEHSARIRLEQQLAEIKTKFDSLQDEKRALSTKAMSLETTVEQVNKELLYLRQQNTELARKKEDVQWVAKSDYEALKKLLQEKEEEIVRLKKSVS